MSYRFKIHMRNQTVVDFTCDDAASISGQITDFIERREMGDSRSKAMLSLNANDEVLTMRLDDVVAFTYRKDN